MREPDLNPRPSPASRLVSRQTDSDSVLLRAAPFASGPHPSRQGRTFDSRVGSAQTERAVTLQLHVLMLLEEMCRSAHVHM